MEEAVADIVIKHEDDEGNEHRSVTSPISHRPENTHEKKGEVHEAVEKADRPRVTAIPEIENCRECVFEKEVGLLGDIRERQVKVRPIPLFRIVVISAPELAHLIGDLLFPVFDRITVKEMSTPACDRHD